jgi:hypothetical protein
MRAAKRCRVNEKYLFVGVMEAAGAKPPPYNRIGVLQSACGRGRLRIKPAMTIELRWTVFCFMTSIIEYRDDKMPFPLSAKNYTKETSMTNKVTKDSKWGTLFIDQDLVPLLIPKDFLNDQDYCWLSINGQEICLTVGQQLQVPTSVAELWRNSYETTRQAEQMMDDVVEIA